MQYMASMLIASNRGVNLPYSDIATLPERDPSLQGGLGRRIVLAFYGCTLTIPQR